MINSQGKEGMRFDGAQEPDVGRQWREKDPMMTSDTSEKVTLRYVSLVLLCVQNAGLVLLTTYVTHRQGDAFAPTTAVIITEAVKVLACLVIITLNTRSIKSTCDQINIHILREPLDCMRISVPSLIYVIQNNLLYVAIANLDAATYQVIYQLKILTTAIFSVIMLGRKLSRMQWFSLLILFIGISVVQLQRAGSPGDASTTRNPVIGVIAILVSCTLSGFAGVYFEKILKGTATTIWIRNIQLGSLGVVIGYITMWLTDGSTVYANGFLFGYDWLVWCVILLQSFGGLMVAVVVKYADNILKSFATALAILISCVASYYLFDFKITLQFGVGTSIVMASVFTYNKFAIPQKLPSAIVPLSA